VVTQHQAHYRVIIKDEMGRTLQDVRDLRFSRRWRFKSMSLGCDAV